ncbi:MAG: hypothetical protein AAFR96_11180 [Planctomycetota bacterium]
MRPTDAPLASTQHAAVFRHLRVALILTIITTAVAAAFAVAGSTPLFQENGPAETAQLAIWTGAALFAFALAFPQPRRSDKAAMIVIGAAAALAAAREMDAHVLLNPETIGEFGVRYRIDWWLDGSVSILRKLAWASIAALAIAAAIAATIAAHFHPLLALKARSRAVIYLACTAACLALGFMFDDLLRGRIPLAAAQAAEESIETLAPIFFIAATNHLAVSALAGGRAALHRRATGTLTAWPQRPTSSPSPPSTSQASPNASPASITTTRPASATASARSSTP